MNLKMFFQAKIAWQIEKLEHLHDQTIFHFSILVFLIDKQKSFYPLVKTVTVIAYLPV